MSLSYVNKWRKICIGGTRVACVFRELCVCEGGKVGVVGALEIKSDGDHLGSIYPGCKNVL